jgi:2'-5' RNA ligase
MRLFIAVPLPKDTEQYLAEVIRALRRPSDGIKWVDPRNIHLTLRFLGDTDPPLVPDIQKEILAVATHARVVCSLGEIGAFPNLSRPRVIWVGLENNIDRLKQLASGIETGVRTIGFAPEDKPFKPHLTLGRVREDAPRVLLNLDGVKVITKPDQVTLDRIVLYQSTLTPQGPIYKALSTAELLA